MRRALLRPLLDPVVLGLAGSDEPARSGGDGLGPEASGLDLGTGVPDALQIDADLAPRDLGPADLGPADVGTSTRADAGSGPHGGSNRDAGSPDAGGLPPECSFPIEVGPRDGAFRSYRFGGARGRCVPFEYGGCGGIANNFESLSACPAICGGMPAACGRSTDASCAPLEYCEHPRGDCGETGQAGRCTPLRTSVSVDDPVCGCDGLTYANECFAAVAGTDFDTREPGLAWPRRSVSLPSRLVRLSELVETSSAVGATRKRKEKTGRLAALLRRLEGPEREIGARFLAGEVRQGKIGIGYATVAKTEGVPPAPVPTLELVDVDRAVDAIVAATGAGSGARRRALLEGLLARATGPEQAFLRRLFIGEVRQGALEGLLVEAVAEAAELPAAEVRRARMLSGDVGAAVAAALTEGRAGLGRFALEPFTPIHPMLASISDGVEDALARLGEAALEVKLDGARVQAHKDGREVRVYSRRLNEVTPAVPEVVELVRDLPARRLVLDGETIALDRDGRPHPFQVTMRRYGRRADVAAMRNQLPLSTFFFDAVLVDDEELLDAPTETRWGALAERVPEAHRVPRLRTADPEVADGFLADALAAGHEGVMAKALDASYEAGRRGASWLKLKPAHTLDLVVLAAEWGSGRRRGLLSNLHLGAREPAQGGFVMLGKTFKGLTDAILAWQTEALLARELGREGPVVHVRPELVVEIALDGVQTSPHYPAGLALRFARVKRYRPDKKPHEADTIETVRGLHRGDPKNIRVKEPR